MMNYTNRIFKKAYEDISTYFNSYKEDMKPIHSFSDKYIVWIIGFSISGILLLIKETDSIKNIISICNQKLIICTLTISVITGVVYRLCFYFTNVFGNVLHNNFLIRISPATVNAPRILNYDSFELEDMIDLIKTDFDVEIRNEEILFFMNKESSDGKSLAKNEMIKYHKKLCGWYNEKVESYMTYYRNSYLDIFDIDLDKKSIFNNTTKYKYYYKISVVTGAFAFYLCNLLFIASIVELTYCFVFLY